jgi:hypothetical protein
MLVKHAAINETWNFIVMNLQKRATAAVSANIKESPRVSHRAIEKQSISSRKFGFKNW